MLKRSGYWRLAALAPLLLAPVRPKRSWSFSSTPTSTEFFIGMSFFLCGDRQGD
jgi:hypothetical protein